MGFNDLRGVSTTTWNTRQQRFDLLVGGRTSKRDLSSRMRYVASAARRGTRTSGCDDAYIHAEARRYHAAKSLTRGYGSDLFETEIREIWCGEQRLSLWKLSIIFSRIWSREPGKSRVWSSEGCHSWIENRKSGLSEASSEIHLGESDQFEGSSHIMKWSTETHREFCARFSTMNAMVFDRIGIFQERCC